VDLHRLAEERSIAFHARVMQRIRTDPTVLERARDRVRQWADRGEPHPAYAQAWARILALPLQELENALVDPSEPARALRQVTPFAGALPNAERWAIWREYAARKGA
jgi:hypothetical protein